MDENERDSTDFVQAMHGEWLVVPWKSQSTRRSVTFVIFDTFTSTIFVLVNVKQYTLVLIFRNVRNMYNIISIPSVTIVKNTPAAPIVTLEGKIDIEELWADAFPKWLSMAKVL